MAEIITISNAPPDFKSMQYSLLREEGLKHIQNLAGKIWTNYNVSDPGVTLLEALAYAITDLGYRASHPIQNILSPAPNDAFNYKNFHSAAQILPVKPVSLNDYRKLLIDTEVYTPSQTTCKHVGVRNAWINITPGSQIPYFPYFVHQRAGKLDYVAEAGDVKPQKIEPGIFYNVLLELGKCDEYGDLNETTLETYITLTSCPAPDNTTAAFTGMQIKVKVEFPRWDDPGVDWDSLGSIQSFVKKLTINFPNFPDNYKLLLYQLKPDKTAQVLINQVNPNQSVNTTCIEKQINNAMYTGANALVAVYQKKVKKVLEVIAEARKKLMANRNLCEDFYKISTVKVEEVALCADVEVTADADVEEVEARIYHEVQKFLSPTVYFRSLSEMYAAGYTTEELFDGPRLKHGFIDDKELLGTQQRKVVQVSDLINLIMDIPGVVAVKKIQIANIPEDNDAGIVSKSVKWTLNIAYAENYIPRLTTALSRLTFYKGPLPFGSNQAEVDARLAELEDEARPQKIEDALTDILPLAGEYQNLEDYTSVQDELPLVYGVGPEGLPSTAGNARKAQAKQLKAFLLFFDQLLAGYLSQLNGVKQLFSMNNEQDAFGDLAINKTYFGNDLRSAVTGMNDLLDSAEFEPAKYSENLQNITEDAALFNKRRNRFLDHLMARFSEQFTDYAMLVYRLSGKKGPQELLTDKLEMLNAYPEISSGRFNAFNYERQAGIWSGENTSGFEKRTALLNGIATPGASALFFRNSIAIALNGTSGKWEFEVKDSNNANNVVLRNTGTGFSSKDACKLAVEKALLAGINRENYQILDNTGNIYTGGAATSFTYRLVDENGDVLAQSKTTAYSPYVVSGGGDDESPANNAENDIRRSVAILYDEFLNNTESSRHNLSCPLDHYFDTGVITTNMHNNPPNFYMTFTLYKNPFDKGTNGNVALLSGTYTGIGESKIAAAIVAVLPGTYAIKITGNHTQSIIAADAVNIKHAAVSGNNGNYTVSTVSFDSVANQTTVTFTGTPVLSASGNLGTFYYNVQTQAQLLSHANANVPKVLLELAYVASHPENYRLETDSGNYKFKLLDRCSNELAKSTEANFGSAIFTGATGYHPGKHLISGFTNDATTPHPDLHRQIKIVGNTVANNQVYRVLAVTATENVLKIQVNATLELYAGGQVFYDGSTNLFSVNTASRYLVFSGMDVTRFLLPGDKLTIVDSDYNDGVYTLKSAHYNGSGTELYVEEKLNSSSGNMGHLVYTKALPIVDVTSSGSNYYVHVRFDAGLTAINETAEFVRSKFFSHEGLHLLEHNLLLAKGERAAYQTLVSGVNTLSPVSSDGELTYTKFYPIASVDNSALINAFKISGDVTTEFNMFTNEAPYQWGVVVKGSSNSIYDRAYQHIAVTYDYGSNQTSVKVFQPIPAAAPASNGYLFFRKKKNLLSVAATSATISESFDKISEFHTAVISGSTVPANNRTLKVDEVNNSGGNAVIQFKETLTTAKDNFLPINLKDPCEDCRITNPYSFIGSVVLPYWQGRFMDMDFRNHFERTLLTECPAHIAINVCWVNPEHMQEFELNYKKWLVENSRKTKDVFTLSKALNDLITTLVKLRTVYPGGTLHDCEAETVKGNSIVLNQTTIGTIKI